MRKFYMCALSMLLAVAATLPAQGASVKPAGFTDGTLEAGMQSRRALQPLMKKATSTAAARQLSSRAAEEGEHPASLVGKTYVAVYNDQTYNLNEGVEVVAGTDGRIVLQGLAEGYDVNATYDPATGKITIPTGVVVGSHSTYGDVTLHGAFTDGWSDDPVTATVNGDVITFDAGLYGTVVYQGQQGGLVVMLDVEATEANGTITVSQTNSQTGATAEHTYPLLVTKTTDTSLSVVGISNLYGGRYYEVPLSFSEQTQKCTLEFGEPVDAAYVSQTQIAVFYLGGINAAGFLDNLEMNVITSEGNTLMNATGAAFLGFQDGQQFSGFRYNSLSMTVDFNIFTGEVAGGDDEDTDTPTIDGITYLLDRTNGEATVTGCLPTLTNLDIPAQIVSAGNTYAVVAIKEAAFQANSTVTSLTIPASIRTIGTDAFRNLRGIKNVYITDLSAWCAVEIANGNANPIYNLFSASSENRWGKLYINGELASTDIVIPEGVTKMARTFYGYKPLTSVALPSTLTELGDQTFANCTKLAQVEVPAGVEEIGSAFFSCSGLKTVKLNAGLKALNGSTFYGCKALESINLPEGLETIGGMAFSSCSALTSIELPSTVTTLGMMAFDGCSGLTELKSAATVPPTAQMFAFDGVDLSIPIYVPAGTIDAYKAADEWSAFTNYQEMAGIESAVADDLSAPVEYFNLSGIRVDSPAKGLYIRRQGSKVEKVIL